MYFFLDQGDFLRIITIVLLGLFPAIEDGMNLSFSWRPFFVLSFLGLGVNLLLYGREHHGELSALIIVLTMLMGIILHLKPQAMGAGDFLFLGILAYALPWDHFIVVLVLSCLMGLCYYVAATMWWKDNFNGAMPFVSILWITTLGLEGLVWFAHFS